jgi:hypothetical protein
MSVQEPFDEFEFDETFLADAPKEASAEERLAQARRIARANDQLRARGEIADGSGKPMFRKMRKGAPWILIGAVVGGVIILIAVLAN